MFIISQTSIAFLIEFAVFSATVVLPTASTTPTTGTTGASTLSASDSGVSILPTSSSAAALSYPVQTGLLGLFSLIGFALA